MSSNLVIVIAGSTASGKSALAIDIACALNGVVINADSMQMYENTPILAAMPSADDMKKVPHKLFGVWKAAKTGSVVEWLDLAVEEIKQAWLSGKIAVVVGGTGLYVDNLINGTTVIPEIGRGKLEKNLEEMYAELKEFDKESWERLSPNDKTRVTRAYEVFKQTGVSLSEWHKKPMAKRLPEAEFVVVKLLPSVEEIDKRCYIRFEKMIELGAIEEVRELMRLRLNNDLPAMRALGVPEIMSYLKSEISLEEAVELGKLHTRQYAKRQRTWFKNKLKADLVFEEPYSGQKELLKTLIGVARMKESV